MKATRAWGRWHKIGPTQFRVVAQKVDDHVTIGVEIQSSGGIPRIMLRDDMEMAAAGLQFERRDAQLARLEHQKPRTPGAYIYPPSDPRGPGN